MCCKVKCYSVFFFETGPALCLQRMEYFSFNLMLTDSHIVAIIGMAVDYSVP